MRRSRRVLVHGAGGPEVLTVRSVEVPQPRRGEVRVAVHLAGVGFGDVMRRRGVLAPWRPFTPGYDVVGHIDAAGARVDGACVGQRVGVLCRPIGLGGYADHLCAPASRIVRLPDTLDDAQALGLGLNTISAHQIVHRLLRLDPGDSMLVHGAAGGVGSALLEVGRAAGLELYGTASAAKHSAVRARGATPIDYRTEDFVQCLPDGVDAVTDPIGGAHLLRSHAALKPDGCLVFFGISGDVAGGMPAVARAAATALRLKVFGQGRRLRLYGIGVPPVSSHALAVADWQALVDTPVPFHTDIAARVPLAEVRQAHALLEGGTTVGKIVLVCT